MQKLLIINADDFGMSREVNEGTKKGIEQGIITSVSVMANMPYFDDAITFLKKHPKVSVGLHFNITEGKPLILPKNAGNLIREDDYFFHWPQLLSKVGFKNIDFKEIDEELKMQFRKLQATGIPITHIDSHHHIHLYPSLFALVSKFADQHGISSLRGHYFNFWNLNLGVWKKPIPTQTIVNMFLILINIKRYNYNHLYKINRFYDINWAKDISTEDFLKILNKLPDGTTEFICHLATLSKTGNKKFLIPRNNALKLLTQPLIKKHLTKNGIKLVPHEIIMKRKTPQ
ncbi:chitin disaccharide deacetylase [soil metagenome]